MLNSLYEETSMKTSHMTIYVYQISLTNTATFTPGLPFWACISVLRDTDHYIRQEKKFTLFMRNWCKEYKEGVKVRSKLITRFYQTSVVSANANAGQMSLNFR